jgi:hypothetical protein
MSDNKLILRKKYIIKITRKMEKLTRQLILLKEIDNNILNNQTGGALNDDITQLAASIKAKVAEASRSNNNCVQAMDQLNAFKTLAMTLKTSLDHAVKALLDINIVPGLPLRRVDNPDADNILNNQLEPLLQRRIDSMLRPPPHPPLPGQPRAMPPMGPVRRDKFDYRVNSYIDQILNNKLSYKKLQTALSIINNNIKQNQVLNGQNIQLQNDLLAAIDNRIATGESENIPVVNEEDHTNLILFMNAIRN